MWQLYLCKHKLGDFIVVAKSLEDAQEHFGNLAEFTLITDERTILDLRLSAPERVFIAV